MTTLTATVVVERRKLRDLKPLPGNPNVLSDFMQAHLRGALHEFGYLNVIVVNRPTDHILGGHHRVKALLAEGVEEADVQVADLPVEKEMAACVALNGIHGEPDSVRLAAALKAIHAASPDLTRNLGMSAERLAELSSIPLPEFPEPREGSRPPPKLNAGGLREVECPGCGHKFPAKTE